MQIRPFERCHIDQVIEFANKWIGENYFSRYELEELCQAGEDASFVAIQDDRIVALRLTLLPGRWSSLIQRGVSGKSYPCPLEDVAYFKSLFIHEDFRGQGLGPELSNRSLEVLTELGAKAVLCHSWLESPGNSSQKYLLKYGFKEIARHPKFWAHLDYQCVRCGKGRCQCTAVEMLKEL